MTYEKNIWEDRIVQYPNRYRDQNDNLLILTPEPGEIAKIGTLVDAEKMNNIENGIEEISKEINKNLITNGPAVKTGFKRNGHDVYVKEFSAPVAVGDYKTISIPNFSDDDILYDWDAFIAKSGAGDIRVKAGFFATPTNFFSIHPNGKNISIFLGTETDWVGTDKKIYITVWYEKVEEVISNEN